MKETLLNILGIDPQPVLEDGGPVQTELIWTNAPQSWMVFIVIAAVLATLYAVFWLYRREIATCPRPIRLGLGVIRAVVLLLLFLVLLGPAVAVSQTRTVQPYILVMIDDSASMSLKDRYLDDAAAESVALFTSSNAEAVRESQPARMALVEQLLRENDNRFLRELMKSGNVRLYRFSSNYAPIDAIRAATQAERDAAADNDSEADADADATGDAVADVEIDLPAFQPEGTGTNLARALQGAMKDMAGQPLAAIVVITDGQHNEGDDPRAVADEMSESNLPVFIVGVGDTARPRNYRVVDVWADDTVWKGDPFGLEAEVQADGMSAGTVDIVWVKRQLSETGGESQEQIVKRDTLVIADGKPTKPVTVEDVPGEPGRWVYSLKIEPDPTELRTEDNADDAVVTVMDNKARVLLVAGAPSWQYRTLRPLLQRDPTIDVSCYLQSMALDMPQEGNTVIRDLPDTPELLNEYDLIILIDPDPNPDSRPADFTDEWLAMLQDFVERGGGLMYAAGPKYASEFLTTPRMQTIRTLLPVRLQPGAGLMIEMTPVYTQEWRMDLSPIGVDHPVTRFTTDQNLNQRIWNAMPPLFWSFPVAGEKPGSEVLLERREPGLSPGQGQQPLLIAGKFGPGRTMYLGFDGTWRWRKLGRDSEFFEKFWIQTVRYLIQGKQLGSRRRGRLATDREVYTVGNRVIVSARLLDRQYQPMTVPTINASLQAGSGARGDIVLNAVPNNPGQYEASVIATNRGLNEVVMTIDGAVGEPPIRLTSQFTVELPDREFDDPVLNKTLLQTVADRTGGAYFDLHQAANIFAEIPDRSESIIIQGKPIPLWDTWRLLMILIVLLGIEWSVRKYYKLM